MQTYLLISQDQKFIKKQIDALKEKIRLSLFNIHIISPAPSIGIDKVRSIRNILTEKPFGGGDRLIILNNIEKATTEAANALLKILEEPPERTYLVLTTGNLDRILPTVISRCQLVIDHTSSINVPDNDKGMSRESNLLKEVLAASSGERILLSQTLCKSKEETIKILDSLLLFMRLLLYKDENELTLSKGKIASLMKKTVAAKNYLERNINYKATLDILFLGFPSL